MSSRNFLLEVLIRAKDEVGKTFDNLLKKTKGLFGGFTELSSAVNLAEKGLQTAQMVIDQTINVAVDYNKQIREMSQVTGLGAEEISRIVQVADDWGIEIGALRTSLAYMNKMGVTPSINNLAKLADEYVNSADKAAFAEKAAKLLGRGYQTLIPLLAKGGQALRDQTKAVEDGLIATEASILAAREYEVALDALNDSALALKMSIGNQLLPELTRIITDLNNLDQGTKTYIATSAEAGQRIREQLTVPINELAGAFGEVRFEAQKDVDTTSLVELGAAADITAGQIGNVAIALGEVTSASLAAEAMKVLNEQFKETGDIDTYKRLATEVMLGLGGMTPEAVNAAMAVFDLNLAQEKGTVQAPQYIDKLKQIDEFYNVMPDKVAGLTSDTYAFNTSVTTVGNNVPGVIGGVTGKFDTLTGKVNESKEAVQNLQSEINNMHGKTVTVKVKYEVGEMPAGTVGGPSHGETGGQHGLNMVVPPGYPNDSYPINVSSGERVIVQTKGQQSKSDAALAEGEIVSSSQLRGNGAVIGGNTFILNMSVNAPAGASAEAIATLAASKVIHAFSRGGAGSWQYAE